MADPASVHTAMVMSPSQDSHSSHTYSSFFGDGSSEFSQMSGMAFDITSPSLITSPTSKVPFGWGTPPGQIKTMQEQYKSLKSPSYCTAIADSPVESIKGLLPLTTKTCVPRRHISPEERDEREIYQSQQSNNSVRQSSPNTHSPHEGSPLHRPSCEPGEQATRKVGTQTREVSLGWFVQQSVDEGMTTIMNRAVSDQSQKPLVHPRKSPQLRIMAKAASLLTTHDSPPSIEDELFYSPTLSSETSHPQHASTPHQPQGNAWNQAMENSYGIIQCHQEVDRGNLTQWEQNDGVTDATEPSSEFTSATYHSQPDQPQEITSIVSPLHDHQKTTEKSPSVLSRAQLTIHPTFGCSVDLSPTFTQCDNYSSQMDTSQSSSSRNDPGKGALHEAEKESSKQRDVTPTARESVPQKTATLCDISPTVASLISPIRRSKLIEQAVEKVRLKRLQSYNLGDRQRDIKEGDINSRALTPSSRCRLIEQVALSLQRHAKTLKLPQMSANQEEADSSNSPPHNPNPADVSACEKTWPVVNHRKESDQMEERDFLKCDTHGNNCTVQISHSSATELNSPQSQSQENVSSKTESTDHFDAVIQKRKTHKRQRSLGTMNEERPLPSMIRAHWRNHYGSLGNIHTPPRTKRLPHSQKSLRSPVKGLQLLDPSQKSASYVDIPRHQTTHVHDIIDSDFSSLDQTSTRYKSLEALSSPHREILYTPSARRRPVTLVVCNQHVSSSTSPLTAAAAGATANLRRISEPDQ